MVTKVQNLGPLDWRIAIVTKDGRPTPEFQRRWASQRTNNGLIGFVGTGDGPPTDPPTGEGELYVDITSTPNILYVGLEDGTWDTVGVINFVDLADVPHDYTASGGFLVQVTLAEDGLEFVPFGDHAADPTAVASDVAVNGVADTYMRSDSAPAVQLATTSDFGLVKPDGTSITISSGVISAAGGGGGSGLFSGLIIPPTLAATGLDDNTAGPITYTDTSAGVLIETSGNAFGWTNTAPTPPYSITVLTVQTSPSGFFQFGWSNGTAFQFMYMFTNGHINVQSNNNFNSYNSTQYDTFWSSYGSLVWFKIRDDGTNVYFMASGDGVNFFTVYSVSKASGFLGGSGYTSLATTFAGNGTILSWIQGT